MQILLLNIATCGWQVILMSEIANKNTPHRDRLDQSLGKSLAEQLKEMR